MQNLPTDVILDTHALIFWRQGDAQLSSHAASIIDNAVTLFVCGISLWEVAMLVEKGRIVLGGLAALDWMKQVLTDPRVKLLPITPEIAAQSPNIAQHGDPADRIIAASAFTLGVPLLTRDGKLQALPDLDTRW